MRRLIVVCLAVAVLTGCELFNLLDPLIGHWQTQDTLYTYSFDPDRTTCLLSFDSGTASWASKGTFSETKGILSMTWDSGTTVSVLYKIEGDTMTWTPTAVGTITKLVRVPIPWQH